MLPYYIGLIVFAIAVVALAMALRRVVPPNEVHIVNRSKSSTPYGSQQEAGNSYWEFPSWIPILGTNVLLLPTTIFPIELNSYPAYDKEKVPFTVDVTSFFQVEDAVIAAKRVVDMEDLRSQLKEMLEGVVRGILASYDVREIMEIRDTMDDKFMESVTGKSAKWGVSANQIEFKDIDDDEGSQVITDIKMRKMSAIEMERRVDVAENTKTAQVAEIENKKISEIEAVQAKETVETRDAERERTVGVAKEVAEQEVQAQARITTENTVAVQRQQEVDTANYQRETMVIAATANKEQQIIDSEALKEKQRIENEGYRDAQVLKAEGDASLINETGTAEAEVTRKQLVAQAEGEKQLAEAKKMLQDAAKEIELGTLSIKAQEAIGTAFAAAYGKANINAYLSNGKGIEGLSDLLSTGGAQQLAGFLDTFVGTSENVGKGKTLRELLGGKSQKNPSVKPTRGGLRGSGDIPKQERAT
jgi:flotillin|tara:strand:+ start:3326 stop:4747 length:1422 start_codon:yes stop_codon:yes gene_type:complete